MSEGEHSTPKREIVPRRVTRWQHLLSQKTKHERFTPAQLPDTLQGWSSYSTQRHIRQIATDVEHAQLWLATWGGVLCFRLADESCIRHTSEHGLPGNAIRSITVDEQGVVWAAGQRGHLATLAPDGQSAWQPHQDLADWLVLSLAKRPQSGVYLALRKPKGHASYALGEIASPDAPLHLLTQSGLAIREIQALLVDEKETLWTGNAWGIHRYTAEGLFDTSPLQMDNLLLPLQVRQLEKGTDGGLWVGTNQGLYRFHPDKTPLYQREADWPQDEVVSMMTDSDGHLWLVTAREIGRVVDQLWQPVKKSPPGQINSLATALSGSKEEVWVGGANGLYRVSVEDCEEAISPTAEDALSNVVHSLLCDTAGSLWLGAARGLYRFDGQSWHDYKGDLRDRQDLRDVRAILPDPII